MAATFAVEPSDERVTLALHGAAGASRVGGMPRNTDDAHVLRILLERLAAFSAALADAYLDSTVVAAMTLEQRRLAFAGKRYPIHLTAFDDYDGLRSELTRAEGAVGRSPTAPSATIPVASVAAASDA